MYRLTTIVSIIAIVVIAVPAAAEEADAPPTAGPTLSPTPPWERESGGGVQAFTGLLDTRKRQLVTSYYLYRGPAPSDAEMDAALGAIDRLILQDFSLEDIWSTIFNILISEPQLAHRPFEEVVPPNIRKARAWREAATPVKVVIEEHYPELSYMYKRTQTRKRALTFGGAGAFLPAYTLSIAFGSAQVGVLYDDARARNLDFSSSAAFLPVIPVIGPVLTQAWMDRQARLMGDTSYDAGAHLVGSVWGTLIQTLGATAMIIGIAQKLPEPFGTMDPSTMADGSKRPRPVSVSAAVGPNHVGLEMRF